MRQPFGTPGGRGAGQAGFQPINKEKRNALWRLTKYVLKDYKFSIGTVLVCIVITSVATLSSTLFTRTLIDDYIAPMVDSVECRTESVEFATAHEQGQTSAEGTAVANSTLYTLNSQLKVAHYDMRFLKPLDEEILDEVGRKFQHIITVEDGVRDGGLGSAVLEWMNDHGYHPDVVRLGLPDKFVEHGKVSELQQLVGIDKESIKQQIISTLSMAEG